MNAFATWERRPTHELRNIVAALGLHPWNNTPAETERLEAARLVLKARQRARNAVKS